MRGDWLESDEFLNIRRLQRRYRRLWFVLRTEPLRKGKSGTRQQPRIQRELLDQLGTYRRHPMTGSVALDIHAVSHRRNPPAMHQVAKYLLDVLGPVDGRVSSPGRRSVLYRDDRQVKFLYVDLSQDWRPDSPDDDGRILVLAGRASDAVAELLDAYEATRESEDEYDDDYELDSSPFWCPPLSDDDSLELLSPFGDENAEQLALIDYLNDFSRFLWVKDQQEAILARNDAILSSSLTYLLSKQTPIPLPADVVELQQETRLRRRDLLFDSGLAITVPPLPTRAGTSEAFLHDVRAGLETFQRRWPVLNPLLVPIKVTFFVVPPTQGKDLDNIALSVLPLVHDVLKPHIDPTLMIPRRRDNDDDDKRAEALRRLRSLNANSVIAYQVVELPRSPEDPPEGILRLALGAATGRSWWHQASDFLEQIADARRYT